jgi:hypothetical protein
MYEVERVAPLPSLIIGLEVPLTLLARADAAIE